LVREKSTANGVERLAAVKKTLSRKGTSEAGAGLETRGTRVSKAIAQNLMESNGEKKYSEQEP